MRQVVVDIARAVARVLVVEGSPAQPRVAQFRVIPLDADAPQGALRQALVGVPKFRARLISVIPREQVITRLLRLPSTDYGELARMVELSGKAQLPYAPEQMVVDFQVLDQQGGTSTVQLVACHRDIIQRQLAALQEAGLEPDWMTPSSWGLLGWYERRIRAPQVQEPVMLIHLDADRTDLVLVRRQRVLFSRSIGQGLQAWQGTDGINLLAQELERSLSSLRKEWPETEAASLLLTGLGPLDEWSALLGQRLGKAVLVGPSLPPFPSAPATSEASPVMELGLAISEAEWVVNLMPAEARHALGYRRRMKQLSLTGILAMAALLLGAVLLSAMVHRQARAVELLTASLKRVESVTKETEHQERAIGTVRRVLESRRRTGLMLAGLFQATPAEIIFESVLFEQPRGELVARGSAATTRQVLDYLHALEQSGRWDRVDLRYSARRNTASGQRTDFEIVLRMKVS